MIALMFVLFSMPSLMDSITSVGETSSEISVLENSILETDISIDTLAGTVGEPLITFNLNNDGSEKLWDYDNFEIFTTAPCMGSATIGGMNISITTTRITPPPKPIAAVSAEARTPVTDRKIRVVKKPAPEEKEQGRPSRSSRPQFGREPESGPPPL